MRKHRIYISIAIVAVFVVVLTSAWAEPGRNPVSGEGEVLADISIGAGAGTATLTIRDETLDATISVEILETFISDEGVIHVVTASHTFDFGGGDTFTTADIGIAEPTDVPSILTLNEKLRVVSGTGRFENASGDLSVHGVMMAVSQTEMLITFRISGSISR